MRSFVAIAKLALAVIHTCGVFAVYRIGVPVFRRTTNGFEPWRSRCMRIWGRGMNRIFGIRLIVRGQPPTGRYILLSNHLSYLDPILYFSYLDCTFVSKAEVRGWPVLGYMVKWVGVIFINRSAKRDVKRVNDLMLRQSHDRQGIVIFPEGTTSAGDTILPIRSSLLHLGVTGEYPIRYAVLRYRTGEGDPDARDSVCWWGDAGFAAHVWRMAHLRRIDALIDHGSELLDSADRKELAQSVHTGMMRLFSAQESFLSRYRMELK